MCICVQRYSIIAAFSKILDIKIRFRKWTCLIKPGTPTTLTEWGPGNQPMLSTTDASSSIKVGTTLGSHASVLGQHAWQDHCLTIIALDITYIICSDNCQSVGHAHRHLNHPFCQRDLTQFCTDTKPSMQEVSSGGAHAAAREARVASFLGPAQAPPRPHPPF